MVIKMDQFHYALIEDLAAQDDSTQMLEFVERSFAEEDLPPQQVDLAREYFQKLEFGER
jgi:hypothetical protein